MSPLDIKSLIVDVPDFPKPGIIFKDLMPLIGNPAGYLPDDAPLERIEVDLPPKEYLALGPAWLRSWYAVFFAALLAASLAIKVAARIE